MHSLDDFYQNFAININIMGVYVYKINKKNKNTPLVYRKI